MSKKADPILPNKVPSTTITPSTVAVQPNGNIDDTFERQLTNETLYLSTSSPARKPYKATMRSVNSVKAFYIKGAKDTPMAFLHSVAQHDGSKIRDDPKNNTNNIGNSNAKKPYVDDATIESDLLKSQTAEALHANLKSSEVALQEHQIRIKKEIKNMLIYFVFLLTLTVFILYTNDNQDIYYFADGIRTTLDASSVKTTSMLYGWFENTLYKGLYSTLDGSETFYMEDTFPLATTGSSPNIKGYLGGTGIILGAIRISTIRQQLVECVMPNFMSTLKNGFENVCTVEISNGSYENEAFGTDFLWNCDTNLINDPHLISSITYRSIPPPNFMLVIPRVETNGTAMLTLASLRSNNFVDLKTRAVFVDMNIYNPSLQQIVVFRILFEFSSSGQILATNYVENVPIFNLYGVGTYILIIIMFCHLLWEIKEEIYIINDSGLLTCLFKATRYVQWIYITCFLLFFVFELLAITRFPATMDPNAYFNILLVSDYLNTSNNLIAVCSFLSWLNFFKYLNFVPKFRILIDTLAHASSSTGGFLFVTGIVLYASSQAFLLTFGNQVYEFRNISMCYFTLVRILLGLGDLDYESFREASPVFAPVVLVCFAVLACFVLLNMFIAIISASFEATKKEIENEMDIGMQTLGQTILDYVTKDIIFKIPVLGQLLHQIQQQAAKLETKAVYKMQNLAEQGILGLADADNDGLISFEEFMMADTNKDGMVSVKEMKRFLAKGDFDRQMIEELCSEFNKDGDDVISYEEFIEQFHKFSQRGEDGQLNYTKKRKKGLKTLDGGNDSEMQLLMQELGEIRLEQRKMDDVLKVLAFLRPHEASDQVNIVENSEERTRNNVTKAVGALHHRLESNHEVNIIDNGRENASSIRNRLSKPANLLISTEDDVELVQISDSNSRDEIDRKSKLI